MATTKKSLSARIAAGFGAVAVATAAVLGGALPASAAPDNVDPNAIGSITLHKFAEPDVATGLANDGSVVDTSGLTPLTGVEFTVERVTGIDLSTNAGWDAAAALTPATAGPLAPVETLATNASGVAVFDELPVGVYLVTETASGPNQIAIQTAPFLVSVPLPLNNTWLYDVHVYPKNSTTSITKEVDDSAAYGLGDQVTWSISVDVPEVAANDTLDEFRITDALDSRLTFVSGSIELSEQGTTAADPRQPVALIYGTHYTATPGPNYSVEFTAAGRNLLAGLDRAKIDIQAVTTVSTLGDGMIDNTATLVVNGTTFTTAPKRTEWGTIAILKHETGDQAAVLAGAEFQVFASEADALAMTNPVEVSGATTFSSGDNGVAFVPGLRAGVQYWIVETKAPVGYQVSSTPIPAYTVVAGDVSATSVDVRVANSQVSAYTLPITGGTGQAAFMIGGAGLLLGALGFMLIRRRKAQADA